MSLFICQYIYGQNTERERQEDLHSLWRRIPKSHKHLINAHFSVLKFIFIRPQLCITTVNVFLAVSEFCRHSVQQWDQQGDWAGKMEFGFQFLILVFNFRVAFFPLWCDAGSCLNKFASTMPAAFSIQIHHNDLFSQFCLCAYILRPFLCLFSMSICAVLVSASVYVSVSS